MFEEEYRREMGDIRATESLIADTLKKMGDEQAHLQEQRSDDVQSSEKQALPGQAPKQQTTPGQPTEMQTMPAQPAESPNPTRDDFKTVSVNRSAKIKRPLFVRVGIPLAACLLIALLGVLIIPQIIGVSEHDGNSSYDFQPVVATTSISGGLQFGSIGGDSTGATSELQYVECSKALLPEGILEATPVNFDVYSVYLGFDEEQAIHYAAYRKENAGDKWIVLRSSTLNESEFIEALESYFS